MESIRHFFRFMNDIDFKYVVLRNFDNLPYDVSLGEHSDLDLLVYDLDHWKEIFPQAKAEFPYPRVRFKVPIDDSYIYCDIRHIGDGYYPEEFQRAILAERELDSKGFYTPSYRHFILALAYHAVHHKNNISNDYKRWLGDATLGEMLKALKESSVGWIAPTDPTVGKFNAYWKGATSEVTQLEDKVMKKQTNYLDYLLINNEYRILSNVKSIHFPKVYSLEDDTITIEHCGIPLMDNLPDDWMEQLSNVLGELKVNNIIHRDIRLDNLMVKDGIIKLIDFGWAKFKDDVDEKEVPSCLGYPNKPSYGYDDAYSMRSVVKQISERLEPCVS